jgi:DNA (cytosine-5)-methyltransferase 1
MKFLSLCSGIEAASVAWRDLGFECVGVSEIEKFPSEVLKHHYPSVPNFGDMTKYKEWNDDLTIDLLVGGTPCQSFSVAGLRKGLDDPRGNLALTYVGIAQKYKPKWFVWENVPGVLSSSGGRDFASFITAMANIGYGIAYRVLDAQFFGVPQRRRRVFVVGYLGDWRPATAVLFEPTSVFGNTPKGRKARKETAAATETSIRADDEGLTQFWNGSQTAEALTATSNNQRMPDKSRMQMIIEANVYKNHPTDSRVKAINKSSTVTARWGTGGGNVPFVREEQMGIDIYSGDLTHDIACTITSRSGGNDTTGPKLLETSKNTMRVRRLTPVECERLQGFPDNWTQIPYGKRPKEQCPDGHRYKALGNSMAVPVMRWIGRRIKLFESLKEKG